MTALIGLDWGTTNARAFRFDGAGGVIERREKPLGIMQVQDGDFAGAFATLVGDWRQAAPGVKVLMCGMIGSRQGWREASYVALPADGAALAAGFRTIPELDASIVAGVSGASLAGAPDVIRGEETQALGVMDITGHRACCLCMPGSHSKWVEIVDGKLTRFATFMTGETFAALKQHTILARMMEGTAHVPDAFAAGLVRARQPGGLLHHLFTVRTDGLFGNLAPDAAASFLSGLLIGHEMSAATTAFAAREIVVVGSEQLAAPYRSAIEAAGRTARVVAGDAAVAAGLWHLAKAARLVR